MPPDSVVPFPGSEPLPDNPLQLVERRDVFCDHSKIVLDHHERVVRCSGCGKVFDPFTFLCDQARHIQTAWQNHRQVSALAREKGDALAKLQAEEKRLRAVVRRLKDKQEAVDLKADPGKPS